MPIRKIVKEGDDCLTKKCRVVTEFSTRLHELLDDMHETLADAHGAGLAAPQVGVLKRIALVLLPDESYLEIINPVITKKTGVQNGPEGCLSIPDLRGMVERPMYVTVEAQDRNGNFFMVEAQEFTARAFCHEIDHLDGKLYRELVSEYIDMDDLED